MKVVCIVDEWKLSEGQAEWGNLSVPKKNSVYTIRDIERCGDKAYYLLHEIYNEKRYGMNASGDLGWFEPSFDSMAFRRLTDISDLQKLTVITTKELEQV